MASVWTVKIYLFSRFSAASRRIQLANFKIELPRHRTQQSNVDCYRGNNMCVCVGVCRHLCRYAFLPKVEIHWELWLQYHRWMIDRETGFAMLHDRFDRWFENRGEFCYPGHLSGRSRECRGAPTFSTGPTLEVAQMSRESSAGWQPIHRRFHKSMFDNFCH